ncbi:MAG: restriction endonuclease subunit S [Candidatus Aenigmatarchaeota archaeon]
MNNTKWPIKKLEEICRIRTGKKDVDEGNPEGKYPFFSCSREITYSDTYSFDTEAILIAGNGDVGATKIYKGKFEAYQRTYVLDAFTDNIKYIYYYLLGNLKKILVRSKSGSTMPYIRKGDLENFRIPIPEDPNIQQKIVSILDTIQEAINIQNKIIETTKELKKSMMADLFKYGGPSFRKNRKLKKTEIGEIPENWEVVRLGEVCEKPQYGLSTSAVEENTGIKLLRITDIQEEKVNWRLVPFCKCTKNDFEKYKLIEGDIVVARIGATTGKTYFINTSPASVFGSYLIRIRPKNLLGANFLRYYFQLDLYWKQINLAKGGRLKGGINIPIIENLQVPLPPLPEQREIADILQTIDQKIEIEQKKKELYEELFKTMLNKIFTGEIDVEKIEI